MRKGFTWCVILLSVLCFALLVSCDGSAEDPKRVNVISVGVDYYGGFGDWVNLYKNVDDAVQIGFAIDTVSQEDCHVYYLVGTQPSSVNKYSQIWTEGYEKHLSPSASNFETVVADVAASSTENDVTIIYVSSHGNTIPSIGEDNERYSYAEASTTSMTDNAYIVFLNDDLNGVVQYSLTDFFSSISEIPGVKVVLGDFCYSGAMVPTNGITVDYDNFSDNFLDIFLSDSRVNASSSIYCIAASQYFNPCWTGGYQTPNHSYFTQLILDALGWDDTNLSEPFSTGVKAAFGKSLTFDVLASWIKRHGGDIAFAGQGTAYEKMQKVTCSSASLDVELFKVK